MHLKNLITRYFKWTRNIPPNGKHFFSKILNRCCWCKDNFWINENPTTFKLSFNEKLKEKCTYKEAALTQTHARVVFTKETIWYVAKSATISSSFTVSLAIQITSGVNNQEILHLRHSRSFVLWISSLPHELIKASHSITVSRCCFKIKYY